MAAVNEMLVQRPPDGVIRVFPAVPKDRPASFVGLRVPGAVLVSAAKSATAVEWVSVRAEQPGEVALAAPWADGAVSDSPEVGLLEDGNVLRWTATPGTVYRFTPHRR
jgi:hypothetical protein